MDKDEYIAGFGARLKSLRKSQGLSQKQLAERVWISKSMISYYEKSFRNPSPEVVAKLAAYFHVTTDYLLGIDEQRTIDVTGLEDEDIRAIQQVVDRLKAKQK